MRTEQWQEARRFAQAKEQSSHEWDWGIHATWFAMRSSLLGQQELTKELDRALKTAAENLYRTEGKRRPKATMVNNILMECIRDKRPKKTRNLLSCRWRQPCSGSHQAVHHHSIQT